MGGSFLKLRLIKYVCEGEIEKLKLERKFFLMTKAPAEMMREFVRSQNFTSTDEIMEAMKDMFKNVLNRFWNVN